MDSKKTLSGRRGKSIKSSSSLRRRSSNRVYLPIRVLPIKSLRNRLRLKSQLSQRKKSKLILKNYQQLQKRRKIRIICHSLKKLGKVFQSQSRARKSRDRMYPCRSKIVTTITNPHRKLQVVN